MIKITIPAARPRFNVELVKTTLKTMVSFVSTVVFDSTQRQMRQMNYLLRQTALHRKHLVIHG